jgi:hypothetical protein
MIAAPLLHQQAAVDGINSRLVQVREQFSCGEFGHKNQIV